jgi:catechol 2,3-dioxygenase-like lactoylglutathione lyase family enzyme
MTVPKLSGVLESALYVEDLEASKTFYKTVFNLETLYEDERLCALNIADRQVLLLFLKGASNVATVSAGGLIPAHDGDGHLHLTFSVAASELDWWKNRLGENEIAIESEVRWARGGKSVYFRDPDKHLLELVTPGLWTIY